jgi:energy-coupling factor transport system ATP-binding protein
MSFIVLVSAVLMADTYFLRNPVPGIIEINNVSYSYPQTAAQGGNLKSGNTGEDIKALAEINLSIAQGEFLAVMGENGCGKTTFCKLINGIIPHSTGGHLSGAVFVDGENTKEVSVPHLARKVGLVLDDPDAQLFTSSVFKEAAFGPENLLLPPAEIEKGAAFALSAVGLAGFENRSPSSLSGGEKQRLAIAAVLSMAGKILVLDEALVRLDPQGAAEVMSVLRSIREKYQITVIMAVNDSNTALEFADRVCVLKSGRVIACDKAKAIIANRELLEENGVQPLFSNNIDSVFIEEGKEKIENRKEKREEAAVEVRDFCYSYCESAVINNINFDIENNDFMAIIGRNGCGKTTLLKNITGLLQPSAGEIYIRGKNSKKFSVSEISREIGFVMQNPDTQLFTDSVYNEVAFALENAGLPKQEIQKRVQDALCTVALRDYNAFPHALDKADRTKIIIACVLAMGCKIIIFDEVDVGQDYRGARRILDIAGELHSKGYTIIFVTHNISLVCEYADRLIVMEREGIITKEKRKWWRERENTE